MANTDTVKNLQCHILTAPYRVDHRLDLALAYRQCQYPDLAAGEAYLALLLIDEAEDESSDYYEQTIAATKDVILSKNRSSENGGRSSSEQTGQDETSASIEDAMSKELDAWSLQA